MSYQQTVNEIRAAAKAVNPNGRFDHGRHVDLSQMFDGGCPIIYLYPIDYTKGIDPDFIDNHNILIGFFTQDKPESTTEEREKLIALMDTLSDNFINYFNEIKGVKISGLKKDSVYHWYNDVVTGLFVNFQYQNFMPCP